MGKLPCQSIQAFAYLHRCCLVSMRIAFDFFRVAPTEIPKHPWACILYVLRQHDHSFTSLPFLIALSPFSALQIQCHVSNLRPRNLVLMAYFVVLGILCLQLRPVSAVSCKLGRLVRAYSHRVAPFLLHLLSFTRYQVG